MRLFPYSALLLSLAVAGCMNTNLPKHNEPVNYAQLYSFPLDVHEKMVINDSSKTPLTQELTGQFGGGLENELEKWMEARIQATGTNGTFAIIVKDANFVETKLPVQKGFGDYFKRAQAYRWDGYLHVTISADGGAAGQAPAEANIEARASQTLGENPSAIEKKATYENIMNKLMIIFNQEADKHINRHFTAYRK